MVDRYFPNDFPDFVEENQGTVAVAETPLLKLLYLPYPKFAERLLQAALDLKEKVVKETWVRSGGRVKDYTLYTGALGTAFLLFKSYLVTHAKSDLKLCGEIVKACEFASRGSSYVTFICGRAGVCALGAVVAKILEDRALLNYYITTFQEIKMPSGVPNELLYGRAGYLWACSFLNRHIGEGTIASSSNSIVVKELINDGRKLAESSKSPLLYEWHGKKYWGAAHGLAGIMDVLMDMDLKHEVQELVKGTLHYMIQRRFPSGNYPSSEENETDRLVHWCHGAPGVSLTLAKASKVLDEEQFLHAAMDAAELVWNRGLLKRVGLCHGISGNTYIFLSLYRQTGNAVYLYRAKAFACFLLDAAGQLISDGAMHGGDHPYSLFEGQAGMAYLFFDMIQPSEAKFPAYEI